jgi:succinate dehydrogenase / fumarate reductase cytochrome b subunit
MKDVRNALLIGPRSDGKLVRRPLSPHAGIYRWPITMISSILNRITGVALSVGALLLVWWLVAAAAGPGAFAVVQGFIASPIGLLLLFGWTFALWFHFFSGLRHLAWDMGYGFEQRVLNPVSYLVLGASIVATLLVWAVGYAAMGG